MSSLGFNCPIQVLNESRHHAEGLDSHLNVIGLMKKMTIFLIFSQGGDLVNFMKNSLNFFVSN